MGKEARQGNRLEGTESYCDQAASVGDGGGDPYSGGGGGGGGGCVVGKEFVLYLG